MNGCANVTPYSYCSNAELKKEETEPSYGVFSDLKQYHFDRDVFCNTFMKFVTNEELTELLSEYSFVTSSFIFKRVDDEFYIIHMGSGIVINWYKHLGRTNTCNVCDFTETNLNCFFKMFTDEWRDEIKKPIRTQEYKHSPGTDINSMYPKMILNSMYGVFKNGKE